MLARMEALGVQRLSATTSSLNFFVIPGNPPALYFYKEWESEWLSLYPKHSFFISPYPDLSFKQSSSAYINSIYEAHKRNFLQYQNNIQGPIILLGHSLGGYFAKRLSEELPELVEKCVLIHPFLRSPKKRAKLFLSALHYARKLDLFEELLLKKRKTLQKLNPDLQHLSDQELSIALKTAFHELKTIAAIKDPIRINEKKKFHLFYTQNDKWCTTQAIGELKEHISSEEVSATHDFVRLSHDRNIMSKKLQALFGLSS